MFKIVMNSYFEDKDKSSIWINKERIPEIIEKIQDKINIDSAYYETLCITKYKPKITHGNHLDAFDMSTEKGIKNTNITGQRLLTITVVLSDVKIKFSKLNKEYKMEKRRFNLLL